MQYCRPEVLTSNHKHVVQPGVLPIHQSSALRPGDILGLRVCLLFVFEVARSPSPRPVQANQPNTASLGRLVQQEGHVPVRIDPQEKKGLHGGIVLIPSVHQSQQGITPGART